MVTARRGQYKLYAYICGAACVQTPDVEGTVSFSMVFVKRPSGCRYAVVGEWDVVTHSERIIVWDLDDALIRGNTQLIPPRRSKTYTDVDQAIMATMMLYRSD